ncbi:hypothetical protein BDZ45DRAFT_408744 [Acephala macrosclerotiorum]|nr:hypothetical protein BDZ45DRAFT_408744 [Acephala macrosclerotiorum]
MLQSQTRLQVSESDCTENPTNKAQQSVCHISRLYRYCLFPFHISKITHSHHTPNFVLNNHHVKMAQYPVAHDPADNASLRQKYREGQGVPMRMAYVKETGATFYPHWHECEIIRHGDSPTMTTDIAFGKREKTEENIRLAEKELDDNTLDLETRQIVEERKTLQWLKEELQQDNGLESQHGALEAEQVEGRET